MHDWYDWMKDIGLPTLVGIGSIAVGAVAALVAKQSHELAKQVRADEAKRDAEVARERHRDQMLQAVEASVVAVLAHRGTLWLSRDLGGPEDRVVGGTTIARFELLTAVADESERPATIALNRAFISANNTSDARIMLVVLGELALALPRLLRDPPEIASIVRDASGWVPAAKAKSRVEDEARRSSS